MSKPMVGAIVLLLTPVGAWTLAARQTPSSSPGFEPMVFEAYPDAVLARLEARDRLLANLPASADREALQLVVTEGRRWQPGSTIRVAFKGGTVALRTQIAAAVEPWFNAANIAFSFRESDQGGFREWSPTDTDYRADIRISFDQSGYWSMVGNDSVQPSIIRPGEASMNFGGFTYSLPATWGSTVLHEFGHALGFQHEHQHPTEGCEREFRWNDDAGYEPTTGAGGSYKVDGAGRRPGIYTVLGGPPNNWPESKVDHNLRQLTDSHAYQVGPFDRLSIMKYWFPEWMFVSGSASTCFTVGQNTALSTADKQGAQQAYPREEAARRALATERTRRLRQILDAPDVPTEIKKRLPSDGRQMLH